MLPAARPGAVARSHFRSRFAGGQAKLEVAVGLEIGLPIVGVSVTYRERVMSTGSIEGIYFGLEL